MDRNRWTVLLVMTALPALPALCSAQVRASESASVAQTIDGTRLTVEYSRPRARNRDSLFGKIVTWDEVWTPGANWATTLETSKDIKVNGKPLAAGKYSVWIVVRKDKPWTVAFDPRPRLFHMAHPDSTAAQIRFDVTPVAVPFSEALTWLFSEVRVDGTTLAMHWGTVRVPIDIAVLSTVTLTTTAEKAAPFIGTWTVERTGGAASSPPVKLFITYENGSLMARWAPPPFPEWEHFYMLPDSPTSFYPAFTQQGKLYDIERGMTLQFTMEGDRATGVSMRAEGVTMATGKRAP